MAQIADRIKRKLSESSDKPIVYFGHETITGGAFSNQIEEFEQKLRSFEKRDCIAINLETSPTALALFIASLSVASNTAVLDTNWPSRDVEITLDSIGANLLVEADEKRSPHSNDQRAMFSELDNQPTHIFEGQPKSGPKYTCFTSGTTGTPKGCVRSEETWIASFNADQSFAQIGSNNAVIVLGSFAHSLGLYAAVRGLYGGAKVVLFEKFDAGKVAAQLPSFPNAVIFGVPTQFVSLTRAAKSSILTTRRLLSTGAKLPQNHASSIQQVFPNADITEFYGTSELSYVSARNASSNEAPTSVGKPLDGVQISIDNTDIVEADMANIGLIKVKSPLAFDGYVIDGNFTPAQDWISVGDTGYHGEGGELHLIGRIDRLFQSSGRNIVPEAIEQALLSIEGVNNAAAFGLSDPLRENRVVAVIDANSKLSRKFLVNALKTKIVTYAIPHKIYLCNEWPKTSSGKTDFRQLKQQLSNAALDELT